MKYTLVMPSMGEDFDGPTKIDISVSNPIAWGDVVALGGCEYVVHKIRQSLEPQSFDHSKTHNQKTFLTLVAI